jgi:peptide/nickel transport system permease protein
MRVLRLAAQRLAVSLPCLAIILIVLFLMLQLAPGDAVDAMLGQMGTSDAVLAEQLRAFYGLDSDLTARLSVYLWRLVRFDLGMSALYNQPVINVILDRLPVTLLLMGSALSLAFAAGTAVGIVAARHVNRWPDTLISTFGLIFYAAPSFWFGLMGILLFAVKLNWLPSGGYIDLAAGYVGWRYAIDVAVHLVLPTLTLALIYFAIYLRVMRASMLEVMTLDFVRTARAKGVREAGVLVRHALRNALLPMVTIIGLQAGAMLGGSVVVESVFSLPGLGRLAYESVRQRDLNMLLGIVFMSSLLVIAINFLVDMLYARLDPRCDRRPCGASWYRRPDRSGWCC